MRSKELKLDCRIHQRKFTHAEDQINFEGGKINEALHIERVLSLVHFLSLSALPSFGALPSAFECRQVKWTNLTYKA